MALSELQKNQIQGAGLTLIEGLKQTGQYTPKMEEIVNEMIAELSEVDTWEDGEVIVDKHYARLEQEGVTG